MTERTIQNLPVEFPKRLAENDDAVGQLLSASLQAHAPGPSETDSWNRLRAARRRPRALWLWCGALASCAIVTLVFLSARRSHDEWRTLARAESWVLAAPTAKSVEPIPAAVNITDGKPAKDRPARAMKSEEKPQSAAATPPSTRAEDTQECASLAREGNIGQATHCYDSIARGSSMAAELALYEKARLESRALGEQQRALDSLNEHSRRFPNGVLAAEVEMTRIELLSRTGRTREALIAIEHALDGAIGRERGADLLAIRGDIYSTQNNCDKATEDYARAKQLGVHPSRIAAGEKRCKTAVSPFAALPEKKN